MSVLNSRNWKAIESSDLVGSAYLLTVLGEIEVSQINETPILKPAVPQGINPKILLLDLSTQTTGDVGGDATKWTPATYSQPVSAGEYVTVDIVGQASVPVERVLS
ncbi:hypothetical protein [Sphingomonas sp.]|uniref:hypothetical protein n=1 Tax=Sphingomonas sp. TaxID=28214 RepID=UPI003D6C88D8